MALSTNTYTASAAQTDFTVGFPYLTTAHVEVYVDGVLKTITTDYTFPTTSNCRFNDAMVGGEIIFIKRVTSHTARLVDYESGGTLNEEDLDTDSLQAFYMAQEAVDVAAGALTEDAADSKFDAESKIIKLVLPGVASTDAVNKAQLDAIAAVAGNVPTAGDPADDLKLLQADGGSFTWEPVLSAFMKTVLDDASADDARTTLGAAPSTAISNVVDDTSPQSGAAHSMNSFQMRWAKGADVVATATLPILADGNFYTVTGSTGITQIAQMAVGTVIMLHFTGTPTITHHATNLILPGGSDIVVAAGDIAVLVEYAAGDWRMINYQIASASGGSGAETGFMQPFAGVTAPSGWILGDGRTMGNSSSSGTNRANADTASLFALLWDNYADTILAVSSGRGASAVADYAANKNIVVPDLRGRTLIGKDDMGGTSANRITAAQQHGMDGDVLGKSGGVSEHTITAAQMPTHAHSYTVGVFSDVGSGSGGTGRSGTGSTTGGAGSSGAHTNMQPSWVVSYLLKL